MESSVLSTNLQNYDESNASRERKPKRKEVLEKKKAINELIKSASIEKDHLASFPEFHQFDKNGLSVYLESVSGDKVSYSLKRDLQKLVKDNMERHYGNEWATEEKVKRREMVNPEARYILAYEASNHNENNLVGFVHYRFTLEEELPVLYVYEIQLQSLVQGKGLGKFLMQLIELIARESCMSAVVLTVQKANVVAIDFYIRTLRTEKLGSFESIGFTRLKGLFDIKLHKQPVEYNISSISPSLIGVNKSYEILCKAFGSEAKAILEV